MHSHPFPVSGVDWAVYTTLDQVIRFIRHPGAASQVPSLGHLRGAVSPRGRATLESKRQGGPCPRRHAAEWNGAPRSAARRVYPGRGTGGVCSGAERAARGAPGSNEPAHDATRRGGAEVGTNAVMPTREPIKTHSCMKGSTTEADHIARTARLADRHESGCSDTPCTYEPATEAMLEGWTRSQVLDTLY